jgi:hypothetical protein
MKTRISLEMLISELAKFGTMTISKNDYRYVLERDFEEHADMIEVRQTITPKSSLRNFCNLAALCFEKGFNPIFDRIIK